jgi:hypothetical protein
LKFFIDGKSQFRNNLVKKQTTTIFAVPLQEDNMAKKKATKKKATKKVAKKATKKAAKKK